MTEYIKASDFTPMMVDSSVLKMMEEEIFGKTTFDFTGVSMMDVYINKLAEIVVEREIEVTGLDDDSQRFLDSHIRKLKTPDFETVEEFKEMFEVKYPKGTVCIWDKTLSPKILPNENLLSLVMLEKIEGNHIYFRLYKSHLMEPKFIHLNGGIDSEDLYTIEQYHISEFLSQEIMFRHPKDEKERTILEIFNEI